MSRRYTSTPLDLRTEDPRSGLCHYCGDPLPARKPSRGRPPVTCSDECKRLYTNRQKWAARIHLARRATRLTHDRSDGALPWSVSYNDVASYDDDADASTMDGYGIVSGALDLLHGYKLKQAVNGFEKARADGELDKLDEYLDEALDGFGAFLSETGQTLAEHDDELNGDDTELAA